MNDARRYCTMPPVDGSTTLSMQMQRQLFKAWMNGFADASECAYGRVGNSLGHVCVTLSNAEYHNGEPINGVILVRDTGQWRAAL